MNIIALLEVTPFDGNPPITCLRIQMGNHVFDLPIDEAQLEIISKNVNQISTEEAESESEDVTPAPPVSPRKPQQAVSQYKMGYSPAMDEDDDL